SARHQTESGAVGASAGPNRGNTSVAVAREADRLVLGHRAQAVSRQVLDGGRGEHGGDLSLRPGEVDPHSLVRDGADAYAAIEVGDDLLPSDAGVGHADGG